MIKVSGWQESQANSSFLPDFGLSSPGEVPGVLYEQHGMNKYVWLYMDTYFVLATERSC